MQPRQIITDYIPHNLKIGTKVLMYNLSNKEHPYD